MLKKGFTLVELLIVIVVIAILTSITFRIMGVKKNQKELHETIYHLHALENAIGGYYAAFGSYPPVRLHGSRNIFYKTNTQGIQVVDKPPEDNVLEWKRVYAACQSQPLAMNYPCIRYCAPGENHYAGRQPDVWKEVKAFSQYMLGDGQRGGGSSARVAFDALETPNQLSPKYEEDKWVHCNVFRFGLMSFLLPRFLYMMQGPDTTIYDKFAQWGDNNNIPCKFEDGIPYDTWEDLARQSKPVANYELNRDVWKVALLPSQILTARWAACLEKSCFFNLGKRSAYTTIWGVQVWDGDEDGWLAENLFRTQGSAGKDWRYPPVFSSGELQDEGNGFSQAYFLDGVTVKDGWGEEFYYYSPPPHQGYRLWSAGENLHTFPPWISESEIDRLGPNDAKTARQWKSDDIVHMSN